MRLGILGAGFIGRALATLAVRAGLDVTISNSRGPRTLGSTIAAIGCHAGTAEEAASFGDVVAIAVPFHVIDMLAPAPLVGKVVMDAANYYPHRDGPVSILDREEATTSGLVAAHLPGAMVVKAFNAILQGDLLAGGDPPGMPARRALPIAGDDADAKAIVVDLHDRFGFDVVDAGPLEAGWKFQRAMPAYCRPFDRAGLVTALAAARRGVELPHGSWRA